jgi:hypothetical protein
VARFLVTYHGSGMPTDPAQMSQAREAFGRWLGEAGSAVVDPGAPLRFGGQVSGGDPTPQVVGVLGDSGGFPGGRQAGIGEPSVRKPRWDPPTRRGCSCLTIV